MVGEIPVRRIIVRMNAQTVLPVLSTVWGFIAKAWSGIGPLFGVLIGAFLARWINKSKHLQELRSAAYVDFLRGFGKVAISQGEAVRDQRNHLEEHEGKIIVADAKARIGIYGSRAVVHAVSIFVSRGSQTRTREGMQAFTEVCELMRSEAVSERASFEGLNMLLFS